MRLYHRNLHEYATLVRKNGDHWLVQYDGSDQIWNAQAFWFDVVECEEVE